MENIRGKEERGDERKEVRGEERGCGGDKRYERRVRRIIKEAQETSSISILISSFSL